MALTDGMLPEDAANLAYTTSTKGADVLLGLFDATLLEMYERCVHDPLLSKKYVCGFEAAVVNLRGLVQQGRALYSRVKTEPTEEKVATDPAKDRDPAQVIKDGLDALSRLRSGIGDNKDLWDGESQRSDGFGGGDFGG